MYAVTLWSFSKNSLDSGLQPRSTVALVILCIVLNVIACLLEQIPDCWINIIDKLYLDQPLNLPAGYRVVCGSVEYLHHLLCVYSVHHTEWDRWPGMILLAPLMHSVHAGSLLPLHVLFLSRIPTLIIYCFPFGLSEYTCPHLPIQREVNTEANPLQIHVGFRHSFWCLCVRILICSIFMQQLVPVH